MLRVDTLLMLLLAVLNVAQQPLQQDSPHVPPRWTKAQKYAAEGFHPLDCLAGQVRVRGKRVAQEAFTVFRPDAAMKCCGTLIRKGRTDQHGHFFVEPMQEGEYFVQFHYRGTEYVTNFAVIEGYEQCDGTHIEVNFSNPKKPVIETFVDINDSGEPCEEDEPHCYRK